MTDAKGTDQGSVREHLERAARKATPSGERARAELTAHPLPAVFRVLWRRFCDLSAWRGAGGFGAAPLTLQDVTAYEQRFGVTFLPGELDLLKRLDAVTLSGAA